MNIADIRRQYLLSELNEEDAGTDPVIFFATWLSNAIESQVIEPTAMVLSTVNERCMPSSRVVLLKACEEGEFRFFTNYNSTKGIHISLNPSASLLFFWKELERQVRIEGQIHQLSSQLSDEYFNTRPAENRLGAIVSPQSQVIESREELESLYLSKMQMLKTDNELVRPEHWGGYALVPESIEFWQGRASRLHDRIRFRLKDNKWIRERLAP